MKIETVEAAFLEIDRSQERVPVEAIEFLQSQESNDVITQKIVFSLENAYNKDVYYNEVEDYYYPTPIWYAVVAEEHLSETLIQPIIQLFISEKEQDWDYLNEQGSVLAGKICEALGEKAVTPMLETIRDYSKIEDQYATLYLFDCLYYINKEKHLPIIFDILENDEYRWLEPFVIDLAHAQITETFDRLKEIRQTRQLKQEQKPNAYFKHFIKEIDFAIEEFETGKLKYPSIAKPYFKKRKNWKTYYQNFYKKSEPVSALPKKQKIGRNDSCPCGSGKKYKKCCLNTLKEL